MSDLGMPPVGALVISLDFELHWGVRDRHAAEGSYRSSLLGARRAIPRLLELFEEYEVAATWATVGFLFARSREELQRFSPRVRPAYTNDALSPFGEPLGDGEADDPLHYAPSLIEAIQRTPRQEIATHTFSHYYCLEPGQNQESFREDLAAACAIAAARGLRLRSIVFPRNQHNPAYEEVLLLSGITAYRGNSQSWLYRGGEARASGHPLKRAGRLLDAYLELTGNHLVAWSDVLQPGGLANVAASCFLRPARPGAAALERLRLKRIRRAIQEAARTRRIFHLWWHPHNFGAHTAENLNFLRAILEEFAACRESYGMRSLAMEEVDRLARGVSDVEGDSRPDQARGTAPLYG